VPFSTLEIHPNQSFLVGKLPQMHEFEPQTLDNLTVLIQPLGGNVSTNPVPSQSGNTFSIIAIVLGALSIPFMLISFLLGYLFGIPAIIMAVLAKKKLEKLSSVALAISIVGTAIGTIFFIIFFLALQFLN
jgi:hypothetical protein